MTGWADDLPTGWSIGRGVAGSPLDDSGSVVLVGPPGADASAGLVGRLTAALADARAAADDLLAGAASVADGERALPTALGGEAVWRRVGGAVASAQAATGDPYAVVVIVLDGLEADRPVERAAAAVQRSVRDVDVVLRSPDGFVVVAPRCGPGPAAALAARLVAALLEAGVGASAAGTVSDDAEAARRDAHRTARDARREVWQL